MYVKVVEVDIIHVVESPLKYYYGVFGALKSGALSIFEKSRNCDEIVGVMKSHMDDVHIFIPTYLHEICG